MALQAGADVNHKDKYSETALHWAAEKGHEALAQGLLAQGLLGAGADINAADRFGWTPLRLTAECNKPEVAKVLLANGAQVNARTRESRTALHIAAIKGHEALAQVDVRPCWAQGRTSTRQTRKGGRRSTTPHWRTSPRLPRCCWRTGPKSMRATMAVAQRWGGPGANPRWRRCSCSTAPSEGACRGARRYRRPTH